MLFVLVYAGVHLYYARLEKRLLATSATVAKQAVVSPDSGHKQVKKSPALPAQGNDFSVIVDRNIFGAVLVQEAGAKQTAVPEIKEEPKETTLKLVLLGTISGDERDARAIIVDEKEKKQDLYQVGDAVQGALITAIERGKVILEFNGRKQFLLIKERKGGDHEGVQGGFMPQPPSSGLERRDSPFPRSSPEAPAPVVPHRRISFRPGKPVQRPKQEKIGTAAVEETVPAEDAPKALAPELEELNN